MLFSWSLISHNICPAVVYRLCHCFVSPSFAYFKFNSCRLTLPQFIISSTHSLCDRLAVLFPSTINCHLFFIYAHALAILSASRFLLLALLSRSSVPIVHYWNCFIRVIFLSHIVCPHAIFQLIAHLLSVWICFPAWMSRWVSFLASDVNRLFSLHVAYVLTRLRPTILSGLWTRSCWDLSWV